MNLRYVKERGGPGEFEADEGDEMEAGQDIEATLVVANEASEAGLPGEGALDYPSARQEDEAALGLGELDHVEADAVGSGVRCGDGTGVALIDEGDLNRTSVASWTRRQSSAT